MAQSVKRLAVDFSLGHDFSVLGSGSVLTAGSLLGILFLTLSLSAPSWLVLSLPPSLPPSK